MRGKIKPLSLHPQSRNKRWFEKVTIAKQNDLVAQLVEQMTLNHWVEGSIPSGVTKVKESITELIRLYSFLFLSIELNNIYT